MASPSTQTKPETTPETDQPVPWNVVLLDDDFHTYDYVIRMMQELFAHPLEKAYQLAKIVDADAKAAKFRSVVKQLGASRDETVAIGDGANDLKMMAEAGTSVAFRAKPVVRAQANCALDWSGLDGVMNLFE